MLDKVYIIWSRKTDIARLVSEKLSMANYQCVIGGFIDGKSNTLTLCDMLVKQMTDCNQAIVILDNFGEESISPNVTFELGYVLARYGGTKVHCMTANGDLKLPADFQGAFIEALDIDREDFESEEDYREMLSSKIVEQFLRNQKLGIYQNKIALMNNRYLIHDYIANHYSEEGSKCSDYELAQYIIFYAFSAYLFGDSEKIYGELINFKKKIFNYSDELSIAINVAIAYLEIMRNIHVKDGVAPLDRRIFYECYDVLKYYDGELDRPEGSDEEENMDVFSKWTVMFIDQILTYITMVYAEGLTKDYCSRMNYYRESLDWGLKCERKIQSMSEDPMISKDNDDKDILQLILSYIRRNRYMSKKGMACLEAEHGAEKDAETERREAEDRLEDLFFSMKIRRKLKMRYNYGVIDSAIYDNIVTEYFLEIAELLTEYIDTGNGMSLDQEEIAFGYDAIGEFLSNIESRTNNPYIDKIRIYKDRIRCFLKISDSSEHGGNAPDAQ